MRKITFILFILLFALPGRAQFITIMGEAQEVQNDSISTDFVQENVIDPDEEDGEDDIPNQKKRKKNIKKLFNKIGNWLGIKKEEAPQDTVPTDPTLFSYDEVDNRGTFIFTEADEKRYLDSIKYELIKRRHQVLKRKQMVSMPMEELRVTSYFGYRTDPFTKAMKFHNGIDFAAHDYFVNAVLPGIVVNAGYRGGYGYCVELKHGDLHTLYAHLSYILVQKNQPVPAGEPIGISGTTGRSTGEHLHFSVINRGKFIDPLPMLDYLSSILAEEKPIDEEFYMPDYSELKKKGGQDENARKPKDSNATLTDSLQIADKSRTNTASEAKTRRTTGSMLLPKENREVVEGKVYTHGQTGVQSNPDKSTETDLPGRNKPGGKIRYSKNTDDNRYETGPQQPVPASKKNKAGGYRLTPEGNKKTDTMAGSRAKPKSGMILPPGDSAVSVKPLVRKELRTD